MQIKLYGILTFCLLLFLTGCSEETTVNSSSAIPSAIPQLTLQTQLDPNLLVHEQVDSTDDYMQASLLLDGEGAFPDARLNHIRLRGRGHESFDQPKKPYKIKLDKPASLAGLPAGAEWALLASFQDSSLLANMLAMQMGHLLDMPHTPLLVPVELTVNNQYQGLYWLTPHKEVAKGRIELKTGGLLLELGKDEETDSDLTDKDHYQWHTAHFNLPVQLHFPRLHKKANKRAEQTRQEFASIRDELDSFEQSLLQPDFAGHYGEQLDKKSLARLLLVYQFTLNTQIREPQSLYLHRQPGGLLAFGPLWDFDTAFGVAQGAMPFSGNIDEDVLNGNQPGSRFFRHLLQDKQLRKLLKQEWKAFRQQGLGELRSRMSAYFDLLEDTGAYHRDKQRWSALQSSLPGQAEKPLREHEHAMNLWLDQRAGKMDQLLKQWH